MITLNLTDEPSNNKKHARTDKDSFLVLLEWLGNVTAAATELGINRNTGYRWARSVGVRGPKPHPGREEYARLRAAATPRRAAADLAEVDIRTAADWDNGIRKSNNRRIYPDGCVIEYTRTMTSTPAAKSVLLAALQKQIDARYLSLSEREMIRDLQVTGVSLWSIATVLGRSPLTISREVTRNSQPEQQGYQPYAAHRLAAGLGPRTRNCAHSPSCAVTWRKNSACAVLRSKSVRL